MSKIDLIGINYRIGEKLIVSATVQPLLFAGFTKIISEAHARASNVKELRKYINSIQMLKTVSFEVEKTGEMIPMSDELMLTLPVTVGKKLHAALSETDSKAGEIIKEGDGIVKSVIYKLGTPIKSSTDEISELEFHAKLYSDIEDILAEDLPQDQTIALINKLGHPIGTKMQALPSWAIEQITIADGLFITSKILPGFLE